MQFLKHTLLISLICVPNGCTRGHFDYVAAERTHLRLIGMGAFGYRITYNRYPTDFHEFAAYLDGCDLKDVWGTDVRYQSSGDRFEVVSAGPDRKFSTSDDLSVPSEIVMDSEKFGVQISQPSLQHPKN